MTGFGIKEQFEASKQLGEGILWREESFFDQLSLNGSFLVNKNHDELWLKILQKSSNLDGSLKWDSISSLLLEMPASLSRKILYDASLKRMYISQKLEREITKSAYSIGFTSALLSDPLQENYQRRLALKAMQAQRLAWCLDPSLSWRPLRVIDLQKDFRDK